ncbi:hypothetical protein BDP27DRAFT_412783 [Rhodocollybia butyracea]|uniref:F-box domain-containing protein n=1 Tax=Rhodocollybia butyracea TaxID=206335 RepID=A0A9P5Q0A3_9AGAR|nr:hypothetical protein BDP27DRAFT_412783 [Rhodocollybia butyracea]
MSLKHLVDILPASDSLDKLLAPYYECSAIGTLDSGVRYIQRALLGYDCSNPYASLEPNSFGRLSLTQRKDHINYLPVELLREIFMLCLSHESWTHPLNASDPPAPCPPRQLVLSNVCGYWRRVALSFPDLWSTIVIISPAPHHIPMAKLWLERSGSYPSLCISTIEAVILGRKRVLLLPLQQM